MNDFVDMQLFAERLGHSKKDGGPVLSEEANDEFFLPSCRAHKKSAAYSDPAADKMDVTRLILACFRICSVHSQPNVIIEQQY